MNFTGKKLSAGGIGLPVAMVVIWGFTSAFPEVKMPVEVAAAFGAICTFVASILIPDEKEAE